MNNNTLNAILEWFRPEEKTLQHDIVATLLFVVILLVARELLKRSILAREDLKLEIKRRWLVTLRNVLLLVAAIGFMLIWGRELQTLAVSLVAIAAALVLATKEMILCTMGAFYRTSTHAFSLGDRIEINHLRGQVIDTSLLSFSISETSQAATGQGTVNRVVTVPNSMLLSMPVFNENKLGRFVLHTVHVRIERHGDWQRAEAVLLKAAEKVVAGYAEELAQHAREQQLHHAMDAPATEPRVRLELDDVESISLRLQLPVPLGQRARIEQIILREYLMGMPVCMPQLKPAA